MFGARFLDSITFMVFIVSVYFHLTQINFLHATSQDEQALGASRTYR